MNEHLPPIRRVVTAAAKGNSRIAEDAWANRSDATARIAFVPIDGTR